MKIRPYQPADLSELHAINVAGEPGVGALSEAELAAILAEGQCFVAVNAEDQPVGFLLLVAQGARYQSPNFLWFESRYAGQSAAFIYVDRIAIAPSAQGLGLGAALYRIAFEACAGSWQCVCCEVNTLPPNPGSLRFHERLGFQTVGDKTFRPGEKSVVYLERSLSP